PAEASAPSASAPPTSALTGNVYYRFGYPSFGGEEIWAARIGGAGEARLLGVVDGAGRYSVELPAGDWTIWAQSTTRPRQTRSDLERTASPRQRVRCSPPEPLELDLQFTSGPRNAGFVVDADGEPVVHALVQSAPDHAYHGVGWQGLPELDA